MTTHTKINIGGEQSGTQMKLDFSVNRKWNIKQSKPDNNDNVCMDT
jgi:hypothetical protein